MSPLPTSTPPCAAIAASRSSGVITYPRSSQSTPLSFAMSRSTPRPGDALALLVDAVARRTDDRDLGRREAVVHLVVVEDVREGVPLRRALQRHEDVVVRVLEAPGEQLRVAGLAHEVDGVDAPATGLGSRVVERDAEVEHLARPDHRARPDELVGRDEVHGAALVLRAPPSPVRESLAEAPKVLHQSLLLDPIRLSTRPGARRPSSGCPPSSA